MEEGYPGERRTTFLHGVFDDIPIVLTELANAPDWLELHILPRRRTLPPRPGHAAFLPALHSTCAPGFSPAACAGAARRGAPPAWNSNVLLRWPTRTPASCARASPPKITPGRWKSAPGSTARWIMTAINTGNGSEQAAHNGSLWLHTRTRASHIQLGAGRPPDPQRACSRSSRTPGTCTTTQPWCAAPRCSAGADRRRRKDRRPILLPRLVRPAHCRARSPGCLALRPPGMPSGTRMPRAWDKELAGLRRDH